MQLSKFPVVGLEGPFDNILNFCILPTAYLMGDPNGAESHVENSYAQTAG